MGLYMDIKIIVAAHKESRMPDSDLYLPVHVGAAGRPDIGYVRDDMGENISDRNPQYCELTGLYWAWKNVDADFYGLVHYRRYFAAPGKCRHGKDAFRGILDRVGLESMLQDTDIILPEKRNYYIEDIYSHYAHTHYAEHLDCAREIIAQAAPEYLPAFEAVMKSKKAHMFNMMIMGRDKFKAYCAWLFPILAALEERIDISGYDAFQARYIGRVSEILLNVWIEKNQFSYKELQVRMIGKVKRFKKACSFLRAKFQGKKYEKGF